MQFASTRSPTLTPLGQRLLALSRAKLHSLNAPAGARDPTDGIRRGVLVREAIRSAWASLETPSAHHELTSWRAPSLDSLAEEDEEECDEEERWLDAQLADADDDDYTVSAPVYDDEYELEATESYTISYAHSARSASGTDVTVVAVCDSEDEDDDMVDDWLELDAARRDEIELVFAEQLEVVAQPDSEPIEIDSTSDCASVSSDISTDELVTPPDSPNSLEDTELSHALAALSAFAIPPTESLPKLETKPLPEVELLSPPPSYRPTLHRMNAEAQDREDAFPSDDDEPPPCECDRFGVVCDATCAPPALSDCDEAEDDECRTPPLCSLDCSELEVVSGFASFDWKAADRIRTEPKITMKQDEHSSDRALGLTLEA